MLASETLKSKGPLWSSILSISVPAPLSRRRKRSGTTEVTAETLSEFTDPDVDPADVDQAVQDAADPEVEAAGEAERELQLEHSFV